MNFVVPAESSYNLTSIELVFNGVADAGVEVPSITVWSNDATSDGTPVGTELQTLTLSGTLVDGINTFTSSGLTLDAGQTYWIVVRNSGNTFTWLTGAAEPTVGTSTSVVWPGPSGGAADPATWAVTASGFQAARINADEVPEPSIALLSSVALLSLMKRRRI